MWGYEIYDCKHYCLYDSGLISYDRDDVEEEARESRDEIPGGVDYVLYCIDD